MAEVRLETLGDLGDAHVIYAFCTTCRRDAQLEIPRLTAVYGARLRIRELRERLTCRKCGARSREIRIVYAAASLPETSGDAPMHDDILRKIRGYDLGRAVLALPPVESEPRRDRRGHV